MTQDRGGYTSSTPGGTSSTTGAVREEATGVKESAKEAGGHVAQTTADQAREVTSEATHQARDLMREGRHQVREQARVGQHRAAEGITMLADELREMASKSSQSGVASEVAQQASERLHGVAAWLQKREPGDLLDEVRHWARQHPGTFLLGAALAGVAAGRLTRGAVDAQRDGQSGSRHERAGTRSWAQSEPGMTDVTEPQRFGPTTGAAVPPPGGPPVAPPPGPMTGPTPGGGRPYVPPPAPGPVGSPGSYGPGTTPPPYPERPAPGYGPGGR